MCEMARTKSRISTLLGRSYPACVMEQAGRFKTVVLAVIQAARVMEQIENLKAENSALIQAARVMEQG